MKEREKVLEDRRKKGNKEGNKRMKEGSVQRRHEKKVT